MTRRRGKRRDRVYGRPPGLADLLNPGPGPLTAADPFARAIECLVRAIRHVEAKDHAADLARWEDDGGR